jgi:hypothetical protein
MRGKINKRKKIIDTYYLHKNHQHTKSSIFSHMQNNSRIAYGSRITLTSPDPSAISPNKRNKRDTAHSDTSEVIFIPSDDDDEGEIVNERKKIIDDEL